ncbi:MAG: hypothetical protein IPJ45_09160 [Ignavibacteria bacterium]|nr:hypothetical protein [Ignavibacteria bacterium]
MKKILISNNDFEKLIELKSKAINDSYKKFCKGRKVPSERSAVKKVF